MDRARTERQTDRGRPPSLNHLGLFAFNWTRPRTNLSQGESGRAARAWKCERFVYALQISLLQILQHGSFARMNELFRGCVILRRMFGQFISLTARRQPCLL